MIEQNDWRDAFWSQDAVNGGALVRAFGEVIRKIQAESHELGKGTDWVNKHPIVVLYVTQLAHLAGGYVEWPSGEWGKAYEEAREKAGID